VGKVKDTASFIDAARAIHGDRYDYSQTVWAGAQSPVTIICSECGPFVLAHAAEHYKTGRKASGCVRCNLAAAYKKRWGREASPMQKFHGFVDSTQKFIAASKAIHGDRYDYSISVFIGSERKITVVCKDHGEFEIRADSHYRKGCGCRKCGIKERRHRSRKYKTCDCGFIGYGARQFPFSAKGKCAECWAKATGRAVKVRVRNEWDSWANRQGSRFFRYEQSKSHRYGEPWARWVTRKTQVLATRKRIGKTGGEKNRKLSSWDECVVVGIQKLKQQLKDQKETKWNRKCGNWKRSLIVRSKMRPGKS
jgi:hypothetical protein